MSVLDYTGHVSASRRGGRHARLDVDPFELRDVALRSRRVTAGEFDVLVSMTEGDDSEVVETLSQLGVVDEEQRLHLLSKISGMERAADLGGAGDRPLFPAHQAVRERWLPVGSADGGAVVAVDRIPSERGARRIDRTLGGVHKLVLATPRELDAGLAGAVAANASVERARRDPGLSAHRGVRPWQLALLGVVVAAVIACAVLWPQHVVLVLWYCALAAAALSVGFRLVAALLSAGAARQARARPRLADEDLPAYTVVVPAYDEPEVLPVTLDWLSRLDYPADRLQILVMLEESDERTRVALDGVTLPPTASVLVVPDGEPRTKPRACNAALPYATGELLVIYDAEDRPEVDQLRRSAEVFRDDDRRGGRIACVQARLHYYNARQNALTRAFGLEYAAWFDGMLPGLARMRIPFPLGGTSNHFRTDVLRELGGWDAYNVTEDADLGFRLWSAGYTADVLDSTTWEEACSRVRPWVRQRTRWIKGYMMTGAVYTRSLRRMWSDLGVRGTLSIAGLVLGTPLAFMAYPILVALMLAGPFLPMTDQTPAGILIVAGFALAVIVALITFVAGLARYGLGTALLALLHPLYWLLHAVAAWRAAVHVIRRPFVWEKTPHGL